MPPPEGPTRAVTCPGRTEKDTSARAGRFAPGYVKVTCSKVTAAFAGRFCIFGSSIGFCPRISLRRPHSLVRFHDSFAHIHDPVDHLTAGRSEQSVKNKVDKHRAHIPAGGHKQRRRDQQGKSPVNKGQKTGLPPHGSSWHTGWPDHCNL